METAILLKNDIDSGKLEEYQDLLKLLLDHKSGPGRIRKRQQSGSHSLPEG